MPSLLEATVGPSSWILSVVHFSQPSRKVWNTIFQRWIIYYSSKAMMIILGSNHPNMYIKWTSSFQNKPKMHLNQIWKAYNRLNIFLYHRKSLFNGLTHTSWKATNEIAWNIRILLNWSPSVWMLAILHQIPLVIINTSVITHGSWFTHLIQ